MQNQELMPNRNMIVDFVGKWNWGTNNVQIDGEKKIKTLCYNKHPVRGFSPAACTRQTKTHFKGHQRSKQQVAAESAHVCARRSLVGMTVCRGLVVLGPAINENRDTTKRTLRLLVLDWTYTHGFFFKSYCLGSCLRRIVEYDHNRLI